MLEPIIKTSFSTGEVDPALWGRPDMAQWHNGCSVARNMFVNHRGGLSSRAGTSFVGPSAQAGTAYPPRPIEFRFSTNQGYILEFGDYYMRVISNGSLVTQTPLAISGVTKANPCVLNVTGNSFAAGDMLYLAGIGGATQLNNRFVLVSGVSGASVTIADIFGGAVNSTSYGAYTSGGTAARIFKIATPYAAVDLPYLKYTQSVDVMSLTCVNPITGTQYPPYDLTRYSATSWTFTQTTYGSTISPPTSVVLTATQTTPPTTTPPTLLTWYSYVVTAVNSSGDESVASSPSYVQSVDIASELGSIVVTWSPVTGAAYYNIYKAPASYDASVPVGSVFGLAGTSYGTQFVDTNVTQDFTNTPPLHQNPFAPAPIGSVTMTGYGSGYTQSTVGYSISTSTGSGAVLAPVVSNGLVTAVIVLNGGQNYAATDTISFSGGSGASATLNVRPAVGSYPSVAEYFQSRRGYANTLNNPDTLYFTKTGLYTNMDAGTIPTDSDAIISTPWGTQVNGIQWLLSMPGGLIVCTGLDAWQVTGTGGAFSPVTPASQSAQAQEAYGFSSIVKPIKIGYNILYLTTFNNSLRELQYNFFANIYGGQDISFLSSHLLSYSTIKDAAWSKEPNKVLWMVRADGKGTCLTYVQEQKISGWARFDTNGLFQYVASISEPPIDAVYFVVKRYVPGKGMWMYYLERMDDRLWDGPEDCWCVDAGLSLVQSQPAAALTASASDGTKGILSGSVVLGGSGYTAPEVIVSDPTGQGSGASVTLTLTGGVISGVNVVTAGSNYGAYQAEIVDSTGHGGSILLNINRNVTFTASASVFSNASVGQVIRMGGGIGTVTAYNSPTSVVASMIKSIANVIPNDPNNLPAPASSGAWTIAQPITQLTNLEHLEGMAVSCLADGSVVKGLTVSSGTVTLPVAASQITIGLPFTAQAQSLHAESSGGPTIQGKRKRISSATVRFDHSRGGFVGANQPVAAIQQAQQELPWSNLQEVKQRTPQDSPGNAIPLFSGDIYIPVDDDWHLSDGEAAPGMLAVQQTDPLPMNLISFILNIEAEDTQGS